jgi:hypothetical protein
LKYESIVPEWVLEESWVWSIKSSIWGRIWVPILTQETIQILRPSSMTPKSSENQTPVCNPIFIKAPTNMRPFVTFSPLRRLFKNFCA